MAYKLKMDDPTSPDDTVFDVGRVLVKNKGTTTLTKEDEIRLVQHHQQPIKDVLSNNAFLELSGGSELTKKEVDELLPSAPETLEAVPTEEGGDS